MVPRAWLVACGVAACGTPAAVVTAPTTVASIDAAVAPAADAAPAMVSEPDYKLPVAVAPPPGECRPIPRTTLAKGESKPRVKTYDFMPIAILPLRRGPHISERPYVGFELTVDEARSMLSRRSDPVTACWKWAAANGAPETTVSVELTFEPSGANSGVTVTGTSSRDDELVACVREVFAPTGWGSPRARAIHVSAELAFKLEEQPAWTKPPARPKPPKPSKKQTPNVTTWTCPPPSPGAIDEVRLQRQLVVTDWDATRAAKGAVASWPLRCLPVSHRTDQAAIRTAVRSHMGAFNACYADALQRTPDLGGDVAARFEVGAEGTFHDIHVDGVGDPLLHACITTALAALWVYPSSEIVEVNLPFALVPALPTSQDPSVRLAAGDVDGALAEWTSLLVAPHTAIEGCRAHAGILRAMMTDAPWLDDERVRGAIVNLERSISALPPAAAPTCLGDVDTTLRDYARLHDVAPPPSREFAMRHLERYTALLPLAGLVDWGARLRWFYAERLLNTSRAAEGTRLLGELSTDPEIGGMVTKWVAGRAKPELLRDACSAWPY